jgi:HAD superfamily hydrolase (TIGR01509 family)
MGLRAVLFDIDGTLLDSNDAHAHAWLDALRGHGRDVPYDLVRSKIGMGGDRLLRELAGVDEGSTEGRSIDERRLAIFKAHYLPDLGPFPGTRALVDRLRSRGLVCAAVTSSDGPVLADLLREAAVADLMDDSVTSEDVDVSRPDPDLVLAALDKLRVSADEAVMVGDTPYDVAAGKRAGVPVIAFRCGGWKEADLRGAVAVYDGPADLVAKLADSPIGLGVAADLRPPLRARRTAMRGL